MTRGRALLLDGQTTQALACARSLGRAGFDILVASTLSRSLASWSRYCVAHHRLETESLLSMARLRDWARANGATVVQPLTERSHVLVNAERSRWEADGIIVASAEDSILDRAFDKARTLRIARESGAAVPTMRIPGSLDDCADVAHAVGLPCVVKSRFTSTWDGSQVLRDAGTSYVRTPAELRQAVLRHKQGDYWPIVQQFVHGIGKGVFTVCDRGHPLAWFAHQRLRDVRPTGSGSSLRRAAAVDPRLLEPARDLLGAMQWHGPAMVEFRDDGRAPWLMEVNGRFWGSLQVAISAGVDFPRLWMDVVHGMPTTAPTAYRQDVTLRWLWGDVKRFLNILAGPSRGYPGRFPTRWAGMLEILGPQPAGTRSETWDPSDPWPALGEWIQGIHEVFDASRWAAFRTRIGTRDSASWRGSDDPAGPLAVASAAGPR